MKTAGAFYFTFAALTSFSFSGLAQETSFSTIKRKWYLPDQAVVQFAGNIGLLSTGLGYSLKRDKINVDILYGYTPIFDAETSIHTLTGKFTYSPWLKTVAPQYRWEPFQFGTGISYSLGSQFYTTLPKHYPDGYYFWPTSFRLTPFISSAVSKSINNEYNGIKWVKGYVEIGTHDLAILSVATNKALNPWDIISFAFGVKLIF